MFSGDFNFLSPYSPMRNRAEGRIPDVKRGTQTAKRSRQHPAEPGSAFVWEADGIARADPAAGRNDCATGDHTANGVSASEPHVSAISPDACKPRWLNILSH
jgi:hypothetical protein